MEISETEFNYLQIKLQSEITKAIEENYIPKQYIKDLLDVVNKRKLLADSYKEQVYWEGTIAILEQILKFNYGELEEEKRMRKFEYVEGKEKDFNLPKRSTKKSAGYDFYNPEKAEIPPYKLGDNPTMVKTGVKVKMEDDEFLMLVNRSSNPKKKKLVIPNSVRYYRCRLLW